MSSIVLTPKSSYAPRIVAIGGGHGQSNLLRGLKSYSKNLSAIVTVADDGGGSGVLRQELGMPAPGDIRNCMQALANVEPLMAELLDYRFTEGSLKGQSFGNLLLAALHGICGSFEEAVVSMHQVLALTGQVLPVTAQNVQLAALLENGVRAVGESRISQIKKSEDSRIETVSLIPPDPKPLDAAIAAIERAELILIGPGSLYTSIIPNLLVPGIADAIRASDAPKVYLANLMTQDGETERYTVGDHLEAMQRHGGEGLFTACLVNSEPIPDALLRSAEADGLEPVFLDEAQVCSFGLSLFQADLVDHDAPYIRHDAVRLAEAVREIYETCATIKVYR